jgi:hypothetical protein
MLSAIGRLSAPWCWARAVVVVVLMARRPTLAWRVVTVTR